MPAKIVINIKNLEEIIYFIPNKIEIYEEGNFVDDIFTCIEGKWEEEENDGWWDYEDVIDYFEVIEN